MSSNISQIQRIEAHVRAQGRAGTHQAILLAEVDRLRTEIAALEEYQRTAALDALVAQAQEMGEYTLDAPVAPVQATLRASDTTAAPSGGLDAPCACGRAAACLCGVVG